MYDTYVQIGLKLTELGSCAHVIGASPPVVADRSWRSHTQRSDKKCLEGGGGGGGGGEPDPFVETALP